MNENAIPDIFFIFTFIPWKILTCSIAIQPTNYLYPNFSYFRHAQIPLLIPHFIISYHINIDLYFYCRFVFFWFTPVRLSLYTCFMYHILFPKETIGIRLVLPPYSSNSIAQSYRHFTSFGNSQLTGFLLLIPVNLIPLFNSS